MHSCSASAFSPERKPSISKAAASFEEFALSGIDRMHKRLDQNKANATRYPALLKCRERAFEYGTAE